MTTVAGEATRTEARLGPETIALCMIVRDESAVVRRCIDSVWDLIDTWVIVDTGSDDGTQDVVRSALEGVPGWLHERPWRDFGHNRTELLELARGTADYLLLLDADMTVNRHGPVPELKADAYLLAHEGDLAYSVPRVVRGDLAWRFVGATHEYLSSDRRFDPCPLDVLTVEHHADGGSRSNKLTRDLALLEQQLVEAPDDPRTVFYLAQTTRELGDLRRAEDLYRRRVELGGWDEEVFYAALMRGTLAADRDWRTGRDLLADAWERRPWRSEPLYEIATRARSRGDFEAADWATEVGIQIVQPDDLLFVHRWVYDWGMRLERAVVCARLGRLDEASRLTDELLARQGLPSHVSAAVAWNRSWLDAQPRDGFRQAAVSRAPAQTLEELCPGTSRLPLQSVTGSEWPEMNPSIAPQAGDGYFKAIVRAVNYVVEAGLIFPSDKDVLTRNFLATLDRDLRVVSVAELVDDGERPRHMTGVLGFEDLRLFGWRGEWWAVATSRDLEPDGRCVQALLKVGDGRLHLVCALPGPDPERHEKNWMPFVLDEGLYFVYSCRPFTVVRFDETRLGLDVVVDVQSDCRFAGLRGGSQGLPVDDGFLFVTHQVLYVDGRRRYLHRFVSIDGTLVPSGISPPFVFEAEAREGIEFCAGITRRGDDVLMSYGIDDARAAFAITPLDSVIEAIEPLRG